MRRVTQTHEGRRRVLVVRVLAVLLVDVKEEGVASSLYTAVALRSPCSRVRFPPDCQ